MNPSASMAPTPYLKSLNRLLTSNSSPKLGLDRIHKLLRFLGNPQDAFPSIHVAGTNGKGSTCAFINALAMQKGLNVGLFTSPHLLSCRERIQLNSNLISESDFCEAEEVIYSAMAQLGEQLTFFEQITAMAFWYFSRKKVDLAVIEVGLGGRLDATNVITPLASVITRIDLDHMHILGDSLKAIAKEKGGIIKSGIPVVTGFQDPEVLDALQKTAIQKTSRLSIVDEPCILPKSLLGTHQSHNAALAICGMQVAGIHLTSNQVKRGLLAAEWPCRLEHIQGSPDVILDGAHNVSGLEALFDALKTIPQFAHLAPVVVFGSTEGHDLKPMIDVVEMHGPKAMVLTRSKSPRASDPIFIQGLMSSNFPVWATSEVPDAISKGKELAGRNGLIIVTGSLYVAGEARALFHEMPFDPQLPIF